MFSFLSDFFCRNQIDTFGILPLSDCRILRPYLLEKASISSGSVVLFAVPYFSHACTDDKRNISAYAICRDYHVYFRQLFETLLPSLQMQFPNAKFAAFTDHSPIAEIEAAAKAGLGVIGKNHLLLTEKYSSYVFLGEIITDLPTDRSAKEIRTCCGCGACISRCPMERIGNCLSAITQKKGELTEDEQKAVVTYHTAWGCDICQEVCPHTQRALREGTIFSPIAFFSEETIPTLTSEAVTAMEETDFSERAFSWRGKDPILRNLLILETSVDKGDSLC